MEKLPTLFGDDERRPPHQPKAKGFLRAIQDQIHSEDVANTKYKEEYCETVQQMALSGFSLRAFCAHVGITYKTAMHWINNIPEFHEAAKVADMKRHFFYEQKAIENLENREFNSQLFSKLTQTVVKWNETTELHQHVHLDSKNPEQMTARERLERIKQLQESLNIGAVVES
jgi:hypothetical protein